MITAFIASFVLYMALTTWRLVRSPRPSTLAEYFSFGREVQPSDLRDAFFVTNASFSTAFVTLFLMVGSQGLFSLATPISFVVGCLYFSWRLIPRALPLMATGRRYAALLSESTGAAGVRIVVSVYVVTSLWLFTYTELQGFLAFARASHDSATSPLVPFAIVAIAVVFMGYYCARLGFSGVVASDRLQKWLILCGGLAFLAVSLWPAIFIPGGAGVPAKLTAPDFSDFSVLKAALDTFVGFFFAQLLYYDNWQRISAYCKCRKSLGDTPEQILTDVQKSYATASIMLLALYAAPILLGVSAIAAGYGINSIESLAEMLQAVWINSVFAKIIMLICFVYLSAALFSTIEVYVISIVNNLVDDISGLMGTADDATSDNGLLTVARIVAFAVSLTFLPALFIEPNFEHIFTYLFFSANAFVGPLLLLLAGRRFSPWALYSSLAFCGLWPAIGPIKSAVPFSDLPGLCTVLFSIAVSWALSTPPSKDVQ